MAWRTQKKTFFSSSPEEDSCLKIMSFKSTWERDSYLGFFLAENFSFMFHDIFGAWINTHGDRQKNAWDGSRGKIRTKKRDIKIFNFTYRLLLAFLREKKMIFWSDTAAINWHLKSYTEALKRREVSNKFSPFAWYRKAEHFLIFIIDKVFLFKRRL